VCFSPSSAQADTGSRLASSSWDNTVKIWDIFGRQGLLETLQHSSEVVTCDFHPSIKNELVSSTLGGQMFVWDSEEGNIKSFIEAKDDLAGGRHQDDRMSAKKSTKNKHMSAVALSPNGDFVIGGGNSKNICLYDLRHKVLLKRFAITQNRSLDGVLHILNSKNVKEGGILAHEIDVLDSDLEEDAWTNNEVVKGAKLAKNLAGKRNTKLAVRIKCLKFSPDGTMIAAATTEGLVIYNNQLQLGAYFNPFDLDESVTIDNIIAKVKAEEYLTALILALRLGERNVTQTVYKCIPVSSVPLLCAHFPVGFIDRLLQFLATEIESSQHVEWAMIWINNVVRFHGAKLQNTDEITSQKTPLRALMLRILSSLQFYNESLSKVQHKNTHLMALMVNQASRPQETDEAMTDTA